MDIKKKNEAAWDYHADNYFADDPHRDDIMSAFKAGSDWLMQQPLSERLTDEEKKIIRAKYNELKSLNSITNDMFADDTAVFEWLFGKELFEEE